MLSLQQCGKATTVFVSSKDCDIVAQVSKCGSSGLDLIFPVLYPSNNFTAVRAGASTSRFFSSRFVQQNANIWYQMICNVVFVVFWGTLLRPTAGALVLIRKCTTLQSVPQMLPVPGGRVKYLLENKYSSYFEYSPYFGL